MMEEKNKLEAIIKDLNKEATILYKIIDEKDKLIKLQRHYIWRLLTERKNKNG